MHEFMARVYITFAGHFCAFWQTQNPKKTRKRKKGGWVASSVRMGCGNRPCFSEKFTELPAATCITLHFATIFRRAKTDQSSREYRAREAAVRCVHCGTALSGAIYINSLHFYYHFYITFRPFVDSFSVKKRRAGRCSGNCGSLPDERDGGRGGGAARADADTLCRQWARRFVAGTVIVQIRFIGPPSGRRRRPAMRTTSPSIMSAQQNGRTPSSFTLAFGAMSPSRPPFL